VYTVHQRRSVAHDPQTRRKFTYISWDVHDPTGRTVDSYNHKRSATRAAKHMTEMAALLARTGTRYSERDATEAATRAACSAAAERVMGAELAIAHLAEG
jgi:hypothetical protein